MGTMKHMEHDAKGDATMNDVSQYPLGTRVRLTQDTERYPFFIARKGMVGVVTQNDADGFCVRLDEHLPGCEEWDNEVIWADAQETGDAGVEAI